MSSMARPGLGGTTRSRGGPLGERARHVREVALAELDGVLVGRGQDVPASRHGAVHARPAELLEGRLLADGHLDHPRGSDVEARLAVDHDHAVGERGQIRRARRRRPEEDADLGDHAGELDLIVEDAPGVEAAREDLDLLGDASPRRVDQVEQRDAEPLRALLDADDLLHRLLAPRAGLHRVVIGHDAHGAAADPADPGDDAVSGRVRLLIAGEEEVLLEVRSRIQQEPEAIADEELPFLLELGPVLDVPLLDARALCAVSLFAHGALPGTPRGTGPAGFGFAHRMMMSTPLP